MAYPQLSLYGGVMSVFKAYDVRGIYPQEINEDLAYKIGFFLPGYLNTSLVLVGRDIRLSSDSLAEALFKGITDAGADVYDFGMTSTSALYFAAGLHNAEACIQITASHNPPEYNGLKISKKHVMSLGGEAGDLQKLEHIILNRQPDPQNYKKGSCIPVDIKSDYLNFLKKYTSDFSCLNAGIDGCSGMANLYIKDILAGTGINAHYICDVLDGNFPFHQPNPLIESNCTMLMDLVRKKNLDIGLIFDGDADRVMVIDEQGAFVRPDLITALLASVLPNIKNADIVVDIRTSRSVIDFIERAGAHVIMWRVGHAYAVEKLAETGAVLGGELAGHYYFKDFYHCDCGITAALLILQKAAVLKKEGRTLSEFIRSLDNKYYNSGEMNFTIENKDSAISALKNYAENADSLQKILDFDGYRFEYKTWWFNVRKSNTEPYLRLILEAENQTVYEKHLAEITQILKQYLQK